MPRLFVIVPKITIKTPRSKFDDAVLKAMGIEILTRFRQKKSKIEEEVRKIARKYIEASAAWQEISSGVLRGDLGIPLTYDLNKVLDAIVKETTLNIAIQPGQRADKIKITIVTAPTHFNDALALPEAEFISFPSRETIPWLRWVLFEGSNILIQDYIVRRNLTSGERKVSRTKIALMRKARGAIFRIQGAIAGHVADNFVSRALSNPSIELEIASLLQNIL